MTIKIDNDHPAGDIFAVPSTGVGIAGMTERAAAVGGSLIAKPTPQGGFTVQANLPYTRQNQ